ncbi:glycosyl transferase family protein [Thalassococcus sp. S3]|uniref:glycosyl transferase family protein n=1 Tax=Thalassococcus sp. S3 TaxID=2017482 RepID=UPI0010241B08|nr:glycosyl transferase family protein [Thalassococcus sp. S3]QBF30025.1 glycosyl transferase family 3 [Thalassococcus sp. S3]
MTLAPFVRIVAQGKGRARPMTEAEAHAAMEIILGGEAAPEAIGALLMVLRLRGETTDEIAGFVRALRTTLTDWQAAAPALDWPSYAAGRTRGLPWFLLSARLIAQAGHPVLIHGRNASDAQLRAHLPALTIPVVRTPDAARTSLAKGGLCYVPVEALSAPASDLLGLRAALGLRSCINTCLRMANPGGAATSVQGVFHPGYRVLQAEVADVLGDKATMILKGGGGEFERTPFKPVTLFGARGATRFEAAPALRPAAKRLTDLPEDPAALAALWQGDLHHADAEATVTGTAALALLALGVASDLPRAEEAACTLWRDRHLRRAA